MKKLFAFLTIMVMAIPLVVNAIGGTNFVYTAGDMVNFYTTKAEEDAGKGGAQNVGTRTIILEDADTKEDKYVRAWAIGTAISASSTEVLGTDGFAKTTDNLDDVTSLESFRHMVSEINSKFEGWAGYTKNINEPGNISLITLDDLVKVFGATQQSDGTYKIDATIWGDRFASAFISLTKKGIFTQTIDKSDNTVYAIEFTREKADDPTSKITDITVKKVPVTSNDYYMAPVAYFDKTYDCVDRGTEAEFSCYSCNQEYVWLEKGTQGNSCTEVPTVTAKASCVKSPQTGVYDNIGSTVLVVTILGIALVIISKKDLFKQV